jgi:hypothetical protein
MYRLVDIKKETGWLLYADLVAVAGNPFEPRKGKLRDFPKYYCRPKKIIGRSAAHRFVIAAGLF